MRKVHMIRASLEPGGNSDNTCGFSSSSSRRKCRVCVTIETTSLEGSTESLGGRGGQRGRQAERNLFPVPHYTASFSGRWTQEWGFPLTSSQSCYTPWLLAAGASPVAAGGHSRVAAAGSLLPGDAPRAKLCETQTWEVDTKVQVCGQSSLVPRPLGGRG